SNRLGELPLPAFVNLGDRAANLFPVQTVQWPLRESRSDAFQLRDCLALPTSERCRKTLAFEQQQFFGALKQLLFSMFRSFIAQFDERLQSHLRIAQVGHHSSDLAHATILAGMAIFPELPGRK